MKLFVEWKQTVKSDFFRNQTVTTAWCSFRFWVEWSWFQLSSATWWREKIFSNFSQNDVTSRPGHFLHIFSLKWKFKKYYNLILGSEVIWPLGVLETEFDFSPILSFMKKSWIVRKHTYLCHLINKRQPWYRNFEWWYFKAVFIFSEESAAYFKWFRKKLKKNYPKKDFSTNRFYSSLGARGPSDSV